MKKMKQTPDQVKMTANFQQFSFECDILNKRTWVIGSFLRCYRVMY